MDDVTPRRMRTTCLASEQAWASHSSGRPQSPRGWRPDQPDPVGAPRASPTPAKVLLARVIDYKRHGFVCRTNPAKYPASIRLDDVRVPEVYECGSVRF